MLCRFGFHKHLKLLYQECNLIFLLKTIRNSFWREKVSFTIPQKYTIKPHLTWIWRWRSLGWYIFMKHSKVLYVQHDTNLFLYKSTTSDLDMVWITDFVFCFFFMVIRTLVQFIGLKRKANLFEGKVSLHIRI